MLLQITQTVHSAISINETGGDSQVDLLREQKVHEAHGILLALNDMHKIGLEKHELYRHQLKTYTFSLVQNEKDTFTKSITK